MGGQTDEAVVPTMHAGRLSTCQESWTPWDGQNFALSVHSRKGHQPGLTPE